MKLIPENEADKTKDVFVGMWRPPWPEIVAMRKGVTIPRADVARQNYLQGEYDTPLYRRVTDEPEAETLRLYHELLMTVARKFPDETRHQTALRYIQEAERAVLQAGETKEGKSCA